MEQKNRGFLCLESVPKRPPETPAARRCPQQSAPRTSCPASAQPTIRFLFQDTVLRNRLSALRHKIVGLRRYLAPQRDVFNALKTKENSLITGDVREQLIDTSNELIQAVEELDFARDHTAVSQEELDSKINLNISQTMYILSVVTVVFMPLSIFTGLLGANVGGIPWQGEEGFWIVTGLLAVISILQIIILKKLKFF